jgi:hypothetical protein
MSGKRARHDKGMSPVLSRRILLVFWNRGIHLVPRLCVRGENVVLRVEPTRIVQTTGIDPNDFGWALAIFAAGQPRATLGAKTALVTADGGTRREMIAALTACHFECSGRHDHDGGVTRAGRALAIATVTIEHRHRFRSAFVADGPACASARKGEVHKIVSG